MSLQAAPPSHYSELKPDVLKRDRELTLDQFREAGTHFCSLVSRNKWGGEDHGESADPIADMFFEFFLNLDTHPFRSRTGENEYGPQSLVLYADETRRRWHTDVGQDNIYSIAEVNDSALLDCQRSIRDMEMNRLLNVRLYSLLPTALEMPFLAFHTPCFPSTKDLPSSSISHLLCHLTIADSTILTIQEARQLVSSRMPRARSTSPSRRSHCQAPSYCRSKHNYYECIFSKGRIWRVPCLLCCLPWDSQARNVPLRRRVLPQLQREDFLSAETLNESSLLAPVPHSALPGSLEAATPSTMENQRICALFAGRTSRSVQLALERKRSSPRNSS